MMMRVGIWMMALWLMAGVQAQAANVLFDVEKRREQLQSAAYEKVKDACMAYGEKLEEKPEPIASLVTKDGYGVDTSAEPFSWYVSVLTGRALAGDAKSQQALIAILKRWASARALLEGDAEHDTYYALKRAMLPVIVGFSVVDEAMDTASREQVSEWIDAVVRPLDKTFDGDVDHNNHRYLADATLMAWGAYSGDNSLYGKGESRFRTILSDARADGSLPLETRRGSRALWYMRQSLASMVVMAEVALAHGDNFYRMEVDGKTLDTIMQFYLAGLESPSVVLPYASENYKPGPSQDYFTQDMGMLQVRPHGRHYMAFAEAYLSHEQEDLTARRLLHVMRPIFAERPLIDDFSGGNATCFWWNPEVLP